MKEFNKSANLLTMIKKSLKINAIFQSNKIQKQKIRKTKLRY